MPDDDPGLSDDQLLAKPAMWFEAYTEACDLFLLLNGVIVVEVDGAPLGELGPA